MTTLRIAALRALEALEEYVPKEDYENKPVGNVMDYLRAALAEPVQEPCNKSCAPGYCYCEPVQEPVAWRTFDGEGGYDYRTYEDNEDYAAEWAKRNPRHVGWVEPLYTFPPQRPVGTVQEPIAWMVYTLDGKSVCVTDNPADFTDEHRVLPLFTAPPQRKPPATIDEMFDRMDKAPKGVFFGHDPMTIWMEAWRAAEQHHGIKEGT